MQEWSPKYQTVWYCVLITPMRGGSSRVAAHVVLCQSIRQVRAPRRLRPTLKDGEINMRFKHQSGAPSAAQPSTARMRWPQRRWRLRPSPLLALTLVCSMCWTVRANVDMGVFGPLLCPLDEAGLADTQAAEQVAQDWPTLNVDRNPMGTFALVPTELGGQHGTSSAGAWLRLELSPSRQSNASSPRDRALMWARWLTTQRYTVRASTPANIPIYLDLKVLSPRDMLRASSQEPGAIVMPSARDRAPAGSNDTEPISPSGKGALPPSPSLGHDSAPTSSVSNEYYAAHHAHERAQRLARSGAEERRKGPEAPCTVVYAHVVPHSPAIPIPPRRCEERAWWQRWFDQLTWDASRPCQSSFVTSPLQTFAGAPVTVVIEHLDVGLLPRTVVRMLAVLVASLLFARTLVPLVQRSMNKLSSEAALEEDLLLATTTRD